MAGSIASWLGRLTANGTTRGCIIIRYAIWRRSAILRYIDISIYPLASLAQLNSPFLAAATARPVAAEGQSAEAGGSISNKATQRGKNRADKPCLHCDLVYATFGKVAVIAHL